MGGAWSLAIRKWAWMTDRKLRKQLTELRDAIGEADQVDEEGRRLLRDLDEHIQELLNRSQGTALSPRPAMTQGLQDSIRHFEVTHPSLTAALSELLTALSNAGI